eukprot:6665630-Prorocentrum_lima.AAC.1
MTSSLVGSEMCIRDRQHDVIGPPMTSWLSSHRLSLSSRRRRTGTRSWTCLLYTSDAADDM